MGGRLIAIAAILVVTGGREVLAQWTESRGKGWYQATAYVHNTASRFDENGNRTDLFNEDARSSTTSLFFTGVLGVAKGIDVWGQVPIHRLVFEDVSGTRRSTGFGDPRVHVRLGHPLAGLDLGNWAAAVRLGVKLKGGDFPVDSEVIPLTEGQTDAEIIVELGRSFWPRTAYAMVWAGYRWRGENEEIRRRPGNERFVQAAFGASRGGWSWKVSADILDGNPFDIFDLRVPSSRRSFGQALASVSRSVGPGAVEVGVRQPVWGRNLPAGTAVFLGYFGRFDLRRSSAR